LVDEARHENDHWRSATSFADSSSKAADEGVTIRQVVESALRVYLGKQTRRKGYQLKWKTERGRILPGVRLDDRDALFDLMDGRR